MRHGGPIALMFVLGACMSQTVDRCLPACDDDDQIFFAECVASGIQDVCQAGNRRCCAYETECVGQLDDQTVRTSRPSCTVVAALQCAPLCDDADTEAYDACLAGGTSCAAGDARCCADAQECIGSVGDFYFDIDGCCEIGTDCPSGTCDAMTGTCFVPGCGDGTTTAPEQCDDHNQVTEACDYGQMSCVVCDATCHSVAGAARFCGDHTVDSLDGEECDPPIAGSCDTDCTTISATPTCTDGIHNGNETDIDCGGLDCPACFSGEGCLVPGDCQTENVDCGGRADCMAGLCTDTSRCDDHMACTSDACTATGACNSTIIDRDGDDESPFSLGCGRDCNDRDATIHTGAAELCDGIDQDCDDLFDESCT